MVSSQLRRRHSSNQLRHPVDALRFAIDFAQADLDEGSDAQRWSLQLDEFVQAPLEGEALRAILTTTPPLRIATIQAIQRDALRIVRGLIERRFTDVQLDAIYTLGKNPDSKRYELQVIGGTLRDMVLYRLLALIEAIDAIEKLRICPEEHCRRIFLKVTNKEHCSTRCQSRAYMREWRAKHSTKGQKGGRRHGKTTRTTRKG